MLPSVQLARLLLSQHYFPSAQPSESLLDPSKLSKTRVLELGAGIGCLACLLAPIVAHYTVTDLDDLVPLIRKNIARTLSISNAQKVSVSSLDWVLLHQTSKSRRAAVFDVAVEGPFDLIICCDCIYNTGLVPALVEAINYGADEARTMVLVVVELREEDVLREFLQTWLGSGPWEVVRLPQDLLDHRTVAWIGQLTCRPSGI